MKYTTVYVILMVIVSLPIVFYSIQASRLKKNNKNKLPPMIKLVISGILVVFGSFGYLENPGPWWLPPLRGVPFFYCLVLSYSANVWITTGKNHTLFKSKIFHITNILTLMVVVSGYMSIDNLELIITNRYIKPTFIYYFHYLLHILILIYIEICIIKLYKQSIVNSTILSYKVRRYVGIIAFRIAVACETIIIVNLLMYLKWGDTYRFILNDMFFILAPGYGLIPLTNMFPQKMLQKIVRPFEQRMEKQKQREQELLRYLHMYITTIVPKVCLHNDRFLDMRLLIEIQDARDIVFSQKQHPSLISPITEARYLHSIGNARYATAGEHSPPRIPGNPRNYMLAVARTLHRLDGQPASKKGVTNA